MNAMTQAFAKVGYAPAQLPDHLMGHDGEEVPDFCGEIVYIEPHTVLRQVYEQGQRFLYPAHPPFYAHACSIPEGYFEQLMQVAELQHRSVTSQVRLIGDTRATEEGYTTKGEFAQAMMREHLQDTAHISAMVSETAVEGDRLVRYGHIPPANSADAPDYRRPEPRRPVVFEMTRLTESPDELIDTETYDRDLAAAMRALVGLSDWDPAMAYGQLKQWDQLTLLYETLRMSTIDFAKTVTDSIQRLYRESDAKGDEIPRAQIERLNEQLQGLRMQVFDYSRRYKVAKIERERAVRQSGINFPAYLSLAERKVTAQARHRSRRLAATEVDRLNAMTPAERVEALKAVARSGVADYRPRHNGIESPEADTPVSLGMDE